MTGSGADPEVLEGCLRLARTAAEKAGGLLKKGLGRAAQVRHKGFRDLVTELDLAAQKTIIELIEEAYPDHRIMAEEGREGSDLSGWIWVIDPLDGTTNFVHGLPVYAVSIALVVDGRLMLGVIYDPEREELFRARAGQGAWLNGKRLSVSGIDSLGQALTVTGFPYDLESHLDQILSGFGRMLARTQGVRRLGSAALDLAYVAAGRFDVFWEDGLHAWDLAAGALMVEEAGGRVSDTDGRELDIISGRILATNALLHGPALEAIGKEAAPEKKKNGSGSEERAVPELVIFHQTWLTDLGPLTAMATEAGLAALFLSPPDLEKEAGRLFGSRGWVLEKGATPILEETRRQLDEYLTSGRRSFDLPLDLKGTDFQKKVWQELLTIPYGRVVTYGQIAHRLDKPGADQAVGQANGANPVPIIVPCHRVVAAGGLGGYGGGLAVKRILLGIEGVTEMDIRSAGPGSQPGLFPPEDRSTPVDNRPDGD